jgi:BirA family biotin operon repressor/biotin-[acetyl-CoA-carboxylase] ligase
MAVLTHWDGEPVRVWARRWSAPVVEAHDTLGSTNDRARVLAEAGAGPFSVVLAEEQTRGRGRTGEVWHSPPGSGLWISTLLPSGGMPPAHLPLLVSVATARAVEAACTGLKVGIKWPNDLEVNGRKVGGILCEHAHGPVIVGIGLNVRQRPEDFPAEIAHRATSLEAAACGRVSAGALTTDLLRELRRFSGKGGSAFPSEAREEMEVRDVLRGRPIVSQQVGRGVARGIDAKGALLVERPDGHQVRVVAGSVRTW